MYKNRVGKGWAALLMVTVLAQTAIAQSEDEGFSAFQEKVVIKKKKKKKIEKHLFDGYAATGLGYDSNPYLSPSSPYIDYSADKTGNTVVNPDVQSGMFLPLLLRGDYEYRYSQDVRLLSEVKFSGKYFADSALKNADQYSSELSGGVRFRFNKYKREINQVDLKAFVGNVYEIYVDHDDGQPKVTASGDQSNRYQYKMAGAEAIYRYDFRKADFKIRGRYEHRNYEDPDTWAPLDQTYIRLKFKGGYQLTKKLHLGAYYEFRMRDYTERKSYQIEPDGININLSGPAGVNYYYNDLKFFGNYRLTKNYRMKLNYLVSVRNDDNQGYNDYLYHSVTWANKYRFNKQLRAALKLNYHVYDYKNAYAYNQLTTLDKLEASGYKVFLNAKYKFTDSWIADMDLLYDQEYSTDKRYAYEETIAMAMLKYRF